MIKIEAATLEDAYKDAASTLKCSVTELKIEVVQHPSKGVLGLFRKSAIIVAMQEVDSDTIPKQNKHKKSQPKELEKENKTTQPELKEVVKVQEKPKKKKPKKQQTTQAVLNDTIMPTSFVSDQDEEELGDINFTADYDDEFDEKEINQDLLQIASEVKKEINSLFDLTCFKIDTIDVSVYDENTLQIEFKGDDAALLIGKEGYRYKALSYMIFNWINLKYQLQLRLEIAEFLKNQEESVSRYIENVKSNVDRDGKAQTKILDGVLVQIALKKLRDIYPNKYVVIRSTRDGLKYIIINDYHSN